MSFLKNTGKALADVIPGLGKFTFDPTLGKIFVTSGTGVIGYRVAYSLLEAGHKDVRVGVWKGDRQVGPDGDDFVSGVAKVLEDKGAEIVEFDWENEDGYADALHGVKTIFCSIPRIKDYAKKFPVFLQAAKDKKIEHFVKISFLRKGDAGKMYRERVPFCDFQASCDDILEHARYDSRISYTILCASHLMSTPLMQQGKLLRQEKKFVTASYGMGVNYVSPNDVADAAMVVLLDLAPHRNKVYNLSGPGPTKDKEIAKLLSEAYGEPIEHIELGYHDYKASVIERGLPEWMAQDAADLERMKAMGIDEDRSLYDKTLAKLTGRKPETFKEYLANKSCMRPGATFP